MAKESSKQLTGALANGAKRELIARLLKKAIGAAAPIATSIAPRREGRAPLSFAQQRLWFLQQWEPGNPAYNITRAYRLSGPLDGAALARSVDVIARRHEVLRTRFTDGGEQPVQMVSPTAAPALRSIDWRHLPRRDRRAAIVRLVSEEARQGFDLAVGPLLRLSLYRLADDDHLLILAAHQSIFDGRSLDIFYRELEMLYAAGGAARGANLPALPVQYADYALWQRERQTNTELAEQLAYWTQRLGGVLPLLDLPTDRPRSARSSSTGARRKIIIDKTLTGALRELSRKSSTTLFVTLMTAFKILLYRYTGQEDMIVGLPVSQRERPELENLIGCFVNTLALRSALSGSSTARQLLAQMRAALDGALNHRDLPFERLVEELAQPRDLSRKPIFQTLFTFQNRLPAEINLAGVHAEPMECDAGTSKFDLTLALGERDGRLIGSFEYSSELFDGATIDRMIDHFRMVLKSIVADPDRSIAALPLLTPAERKRILIEWNDTAANYAQDRCVHQLFEAQARRTPSRVAVECDGRQLTYRELNERANRLARHLKTLGAGAEKLIGVCLNRTVEMIVGLLAVLKSGAAYVALDAKYPRQRIELMLQDADIELLLTEQQLAGSLQLSAASGESFKANVKVVCIDGDWQTIARHSADNLTSAVRPHNLAYVIYTSGSTGQPKGVAIEHKNVAAFLHWAKSVFGAEELAGVLASTSICFDLSVFEIFAPLCWGGKTIVVDDALGLHVMAAPEQVTLINMVPSAIAELLALDGLPASVKTVNLAGEPLTAELVQRLYDSGSVRKVYDLYGPSETTTYSTYTLRQRDGPATIGRPIAKTKIYLLDGALQPVPIGVPGELYIGGAGVARGYLYRPELTHEKFIPDPFAVDGDGRLYRTGDLARYKPDGNIEYLGRVDNQVKLRGYRIELGEIEAALKRHEAIRDCVVVARDREVEELRSSDSLKSKSSPAHQNPQSQKQLVAYVVANGTSSPAVSELRNLLRQSLPEFMVPAQFVTLESLPLTPNGKVDRNALPLAEGASLRSVRELAAPSGEIEDLVAQIWREVLGLEDLGVDDNFFDLGGHSLLATRVAARLRGIFDVDLPLRQLFELPTVSALSAYIAGARQSHCGLGEPLLAAAERQGKIPLSFAQRRLWFLHQLDPQLSAYNMPAAFGIKGALDIAALERAMDELVARHEVLRTAIREINGEPEQWILPAAKLALPMTDLSSLAPKKRQAEIERRFDEEARRPFDLAHAPLLRVAMLRLGSDEHVLLLNFHHIICDGTSWALFYGELAAVYVAFNSGKASPLKPAPLQFADYAHWQHEWLSCASTDAQLEYWQRQLAGPLAPLKLPADFARPARPSYRGARVTRKLGRDLTAGLKKFCRRQGATVFMTLLAALNLLLARLCGQNDIVVGSTMAGRSRPELEGVMGFFINALALRCDLSGNPSFAELVERLRRVCLDGYSHQDLPFERVVEALNPERELNRNPLFQVMFNLTDPADRVLSLPGCEVERLAQAAPSAKFDLVFNAPEMVGGIELSVVYNADLFSQSRAAVMLDQLGYLLEQALGDPERRLEKFSLVTPATQTQLPDPTARLDDSWLGTIQSLVAKQAARQPKALALADADGDWTYVELERATNRLANYFIAKGIGPKDVVVIAGQRSASLAAALLGVLKAGAAFVILDPAYPSARLLEYLSIARPKAWLRLECATDETSEIIDWLAANGVDCRLDLPREQESLTHLLARYPDTAPKVPLCANDPAYLAFTSGSTGQPKAVIGRHGPISYFLPWQQKQFALGRDDRYCLLSGLGYNHLQRDIFTALGSGAALYVPTDEEVREPRRLASWLNRHEITVLHMTPALGRLLRSADTPLPSLRRIFFGGDALSLADVAAMGEIAPAAKIVSFYGATETQRAVGFYSIPDNFTEAGRIPARDALPIGQGAPAVQLLVLTAAGQLAGIGEVGELCIRSPHLAGGYLNDAAMTAASFIVNPFTQDSQDPNDRMYRTGELARYLPDGTVEWVGRGERRANIRGFRVELAEIEAALSRHPQVRQAAAVVQKFDVGTAGLEERLVAYIEARGDANVADDQLRGFLAERLPHYMVPAHFQAIARLPLGPAGKIDYKSLPPVAALPTEAPSADELAMTEIEAKLAQAFVEVLGVASVGRRENFFHLGGHSLLAAQVLARIRQVLNVDLALRALFEAPTVAALAQRIESAKAPAASRDREEIEL